MQHLHDRTCQTAGSIIEDALYCDPGQLSLPSLWVGKRVPAIAGKAKGTYGSFQVRMNASFVCWLGV